jgi:hypothetical protein
VLPHAAASKAQAATAAPRVRIIRYAGRGLGSSGSGVIAIGRAHSLTGSSRPWLI